jgi:hypothetical protein
MRGVIDETHVHSAGDLERWAGFKVFVDDRMSQDRVVCISTAPEDKPRDVTLLPNCDPVAAALERRKGQRLKR